LKNSLSGRATPARWLALLSPAALVLLAVPPSASALQVDPADPPPGTPVASPPAAPSADDVDLTELSLDELLDIPIEVTSVGKRTQDLAKTAAAIHVLTSEDIRRSGMKTLPDLLRLVPGLHVARTNGGGWAISARGFNGQYNGNMLVLIDGRSLYTTLFAGVFWDVQDIPTEDIERIEVVLGPGGPAWGSNSLNGVINVVTKTAAQTQGDLVSVLVGDELGPELLVRHGDEFQEGHWRAWARLSGNDAMHATDIGGGDDERDLLRAGFRVDWDSNPDRVLTIDGDVYDGNSHQVVTVTSPSPPFLLTAHNKQQVSGEHLLMNWTTKDGPSEQTSLLAYVDAAQRESVLTSEKRETYNVEWQRRRQLAAGHDVVFGAGVRAIESNTEDTALSTWDPGRRELLQQSLFAEDQITLVPDALSLTLGARLEHHTYTDIELQPSARLTWTPAEHQTVWAAVSRALRTPSQFEHDGSALIGVVPFTPPGFNTEIVLASNSDIEPVELIAYEIGWRARLSPRFTLDVTGFYNSFRNNVLYTQGTPEAIDASTIVQPIVSNNDGADLVRGFDVGASFEAREDWRLTAGWAFLDVHDGTTGAVSSFGDVSEGSAPQNQLVLTSRHDLSENVEFDVLVVHVDELSAIDVPAYWRADLRLGWQADEATEWSLGVRNLFHDHDLEWAESTFGGQSETETSLWLGYVRRF